MITWHEALLRLLAALLFCGAVGIQRFLAGKAAGVRTHILVGVGSALFTIVSGYAFNASPSNADRIAAQVVSGIGFIGGGAILKERGSIKGMTTAAGLWAAAALGMAAGAGLYMVGALGTAVILVTLGALNRVEYALPRRVRVLWTVQVTMGDTASIRDIHDLIAAVGHGVLLDALVATDDQQRATFQVEMRPGSDLDALSSQLRRAGAEMVCWWSEGSAEHESAL